MRGRSFTIGVMLAEVAPGVSDALLGTNYKGHDINREDPDVTDADLGQ